MAAIMASTAAVVPAAARTSSRVALRATKLVSRSHVCVAKAPRGLKVVAMAKGGEEGGKSFGNDILGKAATAGDFNILVSAVSKAGLYEALSGAGPFTVFAPDDDAFAAACKALGTTKMGLLSLPNLGDILKFHVVSGEVLSTSLTEGQEVTTLGGKKFKVSLAGGVKLDGVAVKKADIKCSNGIVHRMGGVMIPK